MGIVEKYKPKEINVVKLQKFLEKLEKNEQLGTRSESK